MNFDKLIEELNYSYENVSYFRKKIDSSNIDIVSIKNAEDLLKIPYSEKKDFRKNFPAGVLAKGITLNDPSLFKMQSSGNSGERLITVDYGYIFLQRAFDSLEANPAMIPYFKISPRKHCIYASPNCSDVECSNPNSTMESRILPDGTLVLSVYHDLLTTPRKIILQNIEEIEKYVPQLLYVDPTHFAFLLRNMSEEGFIPPEIPVVLCYSLSNQLNRSQISKFYSDESLITNVVAMTEFGFLATECPNHNIHLNSNSFYFEFIKNGKHAQFGEMAELYVTSFSKGCMPHIRYRTGDIYRLMDEKCKCGSDLPVVQIEGRISNMIFQEDQIILTPKQLDNIVGAPDWLDLYKLQQIDENVFNFSYIPNDKFNLSDIEYIKSALQEKLGENANLNFENVKYIPSTRGGKFQFCTSLVAEKKFNEGYKL